MCRGKLQEARANSELDKSTEDARDNVEETMTELVETSTRAKMLSVEIPQQIDHEEAMTWTRIKKVEAKQKLEHGGSPIKVDTP